MPGHSNVGDPYELGFELWFAIFEQHLNNFAEVCLKLIERRSLGMGA